MELAGTQPVHSAVCRRATYTLYNKYSFWRSTTRRLKTLFFLECFWFSQRCSCSIGLLARRICTELTLHSALLPIHPDATRTVATYPRCYLNLYTQMGLSLWPMFQPGTTRHPRPRIRRLVGGFGKRRRHLQPFQQEPRRSGRRGSNGRRLG